jgi:capsular exopolysaccharide synthesis family protein
MNMPLRSTVRRSPQQALITHRDPMAAASEAFRVLRTNLQFMGLDKPLKSVLITSATPGEGKSTVAANLAVAFAQNGANVCLIDADLRRPTIHKIFGIGSYPGLTTALLGDASHHEQAAVKTEVPGLKVIPSGPIPPNPAELLGSGKMERFLRELEERFDMVIIDTPPMLAVADAAVLAPKVGGVLMVTRAGEVARQQVVRAKQALDAVKANVLGAVLDGVSPEGRDGYYYYYYYQTHEGERSAKR